MALSKCLKYSGSTFQKYKKPNRRSMLKPTQLSSTEGGSKKCLGVYLLLLDGTELTYRMYWQTLHRLKGNPVIQRIQCPDSLLASKCIRLVDPFLELPSRSFTFLNYNMLKFTRLCQLAKNGFQNFCLKERKNSSSWSKYQNFQKLGPF